MSKSKNTEATELTGTPIDDSVFQLPTDYQSTNLADLLKIPASSVQPQAPDAGKSTAGSTPLASAGPSGQGTPPTGLPRCVYCPAPVYSAKARAKRIEGVVVLEVVIQTNGVPGNIRLVKGIGGGLDEEAIQTVRNWRFSPATDRDGNPIATVTPIQISFLLAN